MTPRPGTGAEPDLRHAAIQRQLCAAPYIGSSPYPRMQSFVIKISPEVVPVSETGG